MTGTILSTRDALELGTPRTQTLLMGMLCLAVIVSVVWAAVSRVEILAVADGHVLPSARAAVLRASHDGIISDVKIRPGQRVTAGDVLLALDPTEAEHDIVTLELTLREKRFAFARAQDLAILRQALPYDRMIDVNRSMVDLLVRGDRHDAAPLTAIEADIAATLWAEVASLQALEYEAEEARADWNTKLAEILSAKASAKLQRERLSGLERLKQSGSLANNTLVDARLALLEAENAVIDGQRKAEGLHAKLQRLRIERKARAVRTEVATNARLRTLDAEIDRLETELDLAHHKRRQNQIHAPVAGVVENLQTFNSGQVVRAGDELLTVVPVGTGLEIEAQVKNEEVGFLEPGQRANIRLHAYPASRYGSLPGRVYDISDDAVRVDGQQPYFLVRIELLEQTLEISGRPLQLVSGMTGKVDIVTGERSVASFLFAPLTETFSEAFRER